MILAHRIRLDPNNVQATFFERCAGAARSVYNLGLARWQEQYEAGEKPSWQAINAEINARKKGDLAWLAELPWAVANRSLADLGNAFAHFFRRLKRGGKPGYPRFKSKKRTSPAFAVEGQALKFAGRKVKVPKLGWVRTRQELRFPGKVLSARFTKHAGHWFVSLQVEVEESWVYPHRCETQAATGVDLGVVDLAVLSTGERIAAPRSLRAHETKLRRLCKELSRRTKGGKNWQKAKAKVARVHERIANVRKDVTHKLTTSLVRRFGVIGVEDLNVKGMARGRLAKSVSDAALAQVFRQLDYKAPLAGSVVVKADRWFPSSKTCSSCGVVRDEMPLGVRCWTCDACGAEHDRDENAAKNLRTVALTGIAHRHGSAGVGRKAGAKLPIGWEAGFHAVN